MSKIGYWILRNWKIKISLLRRVGGVLFPPLKKGVRGIFKKLFLQKNVYFS